MTPTVPPSTTSALASGPSHVPGLDGVRALAVTLVIVFHLVPGVLVGGYLGVDVFFVVSGFLITTLLLREHAARGRVSLRGFWVRRARRLLPALVVVLLVASTAALAVGGDVLVGLGMQLLGAVTFSSNWLFVAAGATYFDETVPELFRNLWSLAVEEQFYLVWPLLVVLVLVRIPRWARLAGIGALATASAVWMAIAVDPAEPTRVYYGTDTHAFGLAIGAFLAVLALGRGADGARTPGRAVRGLLAAGGALALAALVALAIVLPGTDPLTYRGGLVAVSVLTAVVIAAILVPRSPVARVLDLLPLRWVGVRSYGLYLWHWPVVVLVAAALPDLAYDGTGRWAVAAIALAITVAAAALSYRFVEQPVRRRGFRAVLRDVRDAAPGTRPALAGAAALLAGTALAVGTTAAVVVDPGRGEVQTYVEAGQQAIADAPAPAPPAAPADDDGGPATGDEIIAIGDSVTLAAAPALQERFPGIAIDAEVSRSMWSAPGIVQAHLADGSLREVVVIALGTNGPIDRATLEQVRDLVGPGRELIVVNAQAPRGWIPGVNDELSRFALVYRNVELANWHDAIQPFLHEMARDRVHFGPIGAGIFAEAVDAAVERLAALPPLRDDAADLATPRPF